MVAWGGGGGIKRHPKPFWGKKNHIPIAAQQESASHSKRVGVFAGECRYLLSDLPPSSFCSQTMIAETIAMKPAVAIPAPATSSNAIVGAASLYTGPVTGTTTVKTTAMKLMPTAPIRVRM